MVGGIGRQVIADPRGKSFPDALFRRSGRHRQHGGRLEIRMVGAIRSERWRRASELADRPRHGRASPSHPSRPASRYPGQNPFPGSEFRLDRCVTSAAPRTADGGETTLPCSCPPVKIYSSHRVWFRVRASANRRQKSTTFQMPRAETRNRGNSTGNDWRRLSGLAAAVDEVW